MNEFAAIKRQGYVLSEQTYSIVLDAHTTLRREGSPMTQMSQVYEEMLAAGIQTSANTYSVMIRALCKRDIEVQKTIAMLKRQSERAGGFVDDLVQLRQEDNAKKALGLFDKALAQGCIHELQMDAFNQLLRVLSHHGDTSGAMHVYDQMDAMPKSSVTFAALINLFGRVGDIDAALVYFDQYISSTTDTPCCHVYTALVDAYLKCGLVDKALDTVTKAIPANRVKITTIPYNAIIRHYCAHDRMLDAETLVANMAVAPDSSSYGPILSAYCQANDFNKANELYASLLRTDISKAYGNLANYALLCLRHGDPAKALEVVNDMRCASLEPDAVLSEQIIMCFLQQGLVKEATSALDKVIRVMSTRSITKATPRLSHTAVCIANAIDGKDVLMDLLPVARALLNGALQLPTALADRIVTCYKQDKMVMTSDWEIVLEAALVSTCLKEEQSFATFVLNVQQHMTSCPVSQDLILRVLTRLDGENATTWKNAFDQQQTMSMMMNPQQASECVSKQVMRAVVSGHVMEAVRIVREELVGKKIVPAPETMRDAIALAGKQGHLSSAHTMYELSIRMYQEHLDQERSQKAVYMATNSILIGHAQQGDMVQAKEYYDAIKRMGHYPDGNAYASLLLGMAHSANTTDEAADALIIYDEAKRHHVKPTTFFYNVVISKLAKARKLEPALRLFDEMQRLFKLTPNIITYGAVISACVRAGSESHACRLFDEMLLRHQQRRGSCQDELRIGPFNNMIQFYVRQQPDRQRALFYFEQLEQYNIQPSAHTYKLLLEAYSTIAPFDMNAAHHLLDHVIARPQPTHYATLIYAYGTIHKDIHRAQQVFDHIVSNQDMEVVYQAMLDTLISNDQLERAEQVYKQMNRRITNKSSSPYIENLLLRGYGQRGWIDKAEQLFERMSDDKSSPKGTVVREPSTYEAMVRAYLDNNLVPKAKCILDRMMSRQFPDRVVAAVAALILAH
ncbi:TPR-like protein [Lichtheimia hyalospora FSU 10163]|nr:TPR-like protein [Lichtheimia hyalospora FSU 10163]